MSDHAPLSPSDAQRWLRCSAALSFTEGMPDKSSPASREGTAAHKLLETALVEERHPSQFIGLSFTVEEEDIPVTEDMADAVAVAFDYVRAAYLCGASVATEERVNPGARLGRGDLWGTLDVRIQWADGLVEVVDYKHGKGVQVEAEGNPQLRLYALPFVDSEDRDVRLTIIQPRGFHAQGPIRSETLSGADLLVWQEQVLIPALEALENPSFTPGEIQCRWCVGYGTCKAAAENALQAAAVAFDHVPADATLESRLTRDPSSLSPEQVAFVLEHESLIRAWLKAAHEHAHEALLRGEKIPGFKLVNGSGGHRKYRDSEDETLKKLRKCYRLDGKPIALSDVTVRKLLSPAQVEKVLKKKVGDKTWRTVQSLIVKPEGSPVIAPESDPRPALKQSASEVFDTVSVDNTLDFLN